MPIGLSSEKVTRTVRMARHPIGSSPGQLERRSVEHLSAIVEATIQALGPGHSRKFVADPFELDQHSWHGRYCVRRDDGMPELVCHRLYLLNYHLQTVEFAINLSLEMRRQRPSIAGLLSDQSLAAVPTQRLITSDALTEQQSLDPIAMLDTLFQ